MKITLTPHLRISPYKGSVATVQIQMPFHAIIYIIYIVTARPLSPQEGARSRSPQLEEC